MKFSQIRQSINASEPRGTARVPVMVMIHGGGWSNGTPEVMAANARFLAERGIATVRIQYRLIKDGGTFPKTIGDVMDAIAWVRASADKYHFDLRRFGLTGGSAGSHLAAIAAQRTPECNVFAGYCGLYDAFQVGEGHFARQSHFVGPSEPERKEASARFQIKTPPPATILFHGLADPTIDSDQAVRFAAALRERGATVELIVVPGGGHEVGNPVLVHQRLLGFLNQQWGLHMAL
jgi:acetyl esterase/lipase